MIQEGKLKLTELDAVRLALESNVDINVERYNPYFSLWEVEKGRGVLNPSILFNTDVNRLVTPSSSVLQGGETVLDLNNLYQLEVHKPFEKGLDLDLNFSSRRLRTTSFFQSLNPSFGSNVGVSLTQHLLKDFGSISRGRFVRIARNSYQMSEEEFVVRTTEIVTTFSMPTGIWFLTMRISRPERLPRSWRKSFSRTTKYRWKLEPCRRWRWFRLRLRSRLVRKNL